MLKNFVVGWLLCGFIVLGTSAPNTPHNKDFWKDSTVIPACLILIASGPLGLGAYLNMKLTAN